MKLLSGYLQQSCMWALCVVLMAFHRVLHIHILLYMYTNKVTYLSLDPSGIPIHPKFRKLRKTNYKLQPLSIGKFSSILNKTQIKLQI